MYKYRMRIEFLEGYKNGFNKEDTQSPSESTRVH